MPRKSGPALRKIPATGILEIVWTEARRSHRKSTRTDDRAEAEMAFAAWLRARHEAGSVKAAPPLAVGALLKSYLSEHCERKCLSYDRQKFAVKALLPFFEAKLPAELSASIVNQYEVARCAEGVATSTVRRELATLVAALNFAAGQHRISRDHVPKISLPPSAPPRNLWLTEQESAQLRAAAIAALPRRVSRFILIAQETAARKNSILQLRWPQVDLVARTIDFATPGERQAGKRRGKVPMSDRLSDRFRQWIGEAKTEWVLDTPHSIQHHWDAFMLKLSADTGNEKFAAISPHVLRHTWATQAARARVSPWEIAGVLGDTLRTVEKNYMHHSPDHLRGAVNFAIAA